jgi:1,4-alpha-glucan branching enzyme
MGIPDYWIRQIKKPDEAWGLNDAFTALLNRRRDEKHIAYVESHDQALVGDKTLAFWLMDAEMYTKMSKSEESLVVDRGVALHKMIRLMTFSLGGEGYLNFMGNEFGHPEWIDFPREGNGWSYQFARRQWSLADNAYLRYQGLGRFDQAMQDLDRIFSLLCDPLIDQLVDHEDTRQIVYRHGPLVFCFNFHVSESYVGLRIPLPEAVDYLGLLSTDEVSFGGQGRFERGERHSWLNEPMYGWNQSTLIYLPARSALVLVPERLKDTAEQYWSDLVALTGRPF